MRRTVCGVILALPSSAWAVGLGSTIAGFGFGDEFSAGGFRPTFDLVFDPVLLQIHVLDTVDAAFDDDLYLGLDVTVAVVEAPIAGPWVGVVAPGGGFDLFGDANVVAVAGECRLGIQAHDRAGFGIYLVPAIGVVSGGGDSDLFASGALQVSAWFDL